MNDNKKTAAIAVMGGDARQAYLAGKLASAGYTVRTYGIEADIPGAEKCGTAAEAAAFCRAVIYPVRPKENIEDHIKEIDAAEGAVIFAWSPNEAAAKEIAERGWRLYDLAADESLTVKNAQLTAEGALAFYMGKKSTAVLGSRVLVTGSGRVAKCVCRAFGALGADVTMMARDAGELAWAQLSRWGAVDIRDEGARLGALASGYDVIINTIPVMLFTGRMLDAIPEGTLVIDLASAPYGIDPDEAGMRGINAHRVSALPGKYAPDTAAGLVAGCVCRYIEGGA